MSHTPALGLPTTHSDYLDTSGRQPGRRPSPPRHARHRKPGRLETRIGSVGRLIDGLTSRVREDQ